MKSAGAWDHGTIHNHVVNAAETVAHGVFDLRDCVAVGAFDKDGDGFGGFDFLLFDGRTG